MSIPHEGNSPTRRTRRVLVIPPQEQGPFPAGGAPTQSAEDTIAARAYALYLARGAEDGHDVEDWLQAERELAAQA